MNKDVQKIIRNILSDIRVELSDEFDKNFERQAFFSEARHGSAGAVRYGLTVRY